jgi:WD40 repeat protein
VLLLAAVAGAIYAVVQRGEARDAETAQLAQRLGAQALVEEDLDLSLLLARQAIAIADTPQTRSYLLAGLLRAPAVMGVMHGSEGVLRSIAISPDGKTLAVGGEQGGIRFFDAATYEQIGGPVSVGELVESLAYSPDGRTLAFTGDGAGGLVDVRTGRQVREADGFAGEAARVAYTKDGSKLVVLTVDPESGASASVTVRDAATLRQLGRPIEPDDFVGAYIGSWYAAPQFALDDRTASLITVANDGAMVRWNLVSGEKTRIPVALERGLHALALSPDGLRAAVGIERGIQLVDLRTKTVRTGTGGITGRPSWLVFSPDGKTVVSTSIDGTVARWDVESAALRETLRGHSRSAQQTVFSPDGRTLYTVSHDGTAIAWDLTGTRGLRRPFRFTHDRAFSEGYDGHPGRFSPDARLIAVGLKEDGIALLDSRRPVRVGAELGPTEGEVKALAFSPDGRTLAAVTLAGWATVWDTRSRKRRYRAIPVGVDPLLGASISADGKLLATAGRTGVKLWNLGTGAPAGSIGGGAPAGDVAFSPTGRTLAFIPEDRGVSSEVWDVDNRSLIAEFPAGQGYAIAFSPDGRTLATGGFDAFVRLWDARTGRLVRALEQGASGARTLEFSPDGRILAVSGWEPVGSLWDVATGVQIGPRLTAGNRRAAIDLSPDGRRLLMTLGNGQGAVWDVDPDSWKRRACKLANRTLTRQEWAKFLTGRRYEPACR